MKFSGRTCICISMGIIFILILGIFLVTPVMADLNPNIVMFDVEGNNHVPIERILGVVSNSKIGSPIDPKMVQQDQKAIMEMGYFSDVQVKTADMLGGVKLTFEVIENPLFQQVQISGLTKVKPEELKPFFTQKPGEVFNTVMFKDNVAKAIKFCQEKKGLFVQPKMEGNIAISPDGTVKLELVELKYGHIKISGLVKTKEVVVRRELAIKTGEIIDRNVLKEEMDYLMRLRLFDDLQPRFEMSDIPDSLDLIIDLKEAQTGNFSFGISYNEQAGDWGGQVGFGENNLMGLGQSLSINADESYEWHDVSFSFSEPWLDENHTSFGVSISNNDNDIYTTINSWDPANPNIYQMYLQQTGISMFLGKQLWRDTSARLQVNFQKDTIEDLWPSGADTNQASPPVTIDPQLANPLHSSDFWDDSLEAIVTKNRLIYQDSNFVSGGYELTFDYTAAGKYLGGAYNYNKAVLDGRWFKSLTSLGGTPLVFGTHLSTVAMEGVYPDYDDLYLGGMYRLRGYDNRRYYDNSTPELIGSGNGSNYILSNSELRWRTCWQKNLEVVTFYDIGEINNPGTSTVKSDWGLGFRYNIPMFGVIRLDYAWNCDGYGTLCFSLGEMF